MDKRTIVAVGGAVAVLVGVAVTRDDGTVVSEDGSAPVVVGSSIQADVLVEANGKRTPLVRTFSDAVVVNGNIRVPTLAGTMITETQDYTPQEVADMLLKCERYRASMGVDAPALPDWTAARDKLVAAGVAIPAAIAPEDQVP